MNRVCWLIVLWAVPVLAQWTNPPSGGSTTPGPPVSAVADVITGAYVKGQSGTGAVTRVGRQLELIYAAVAGSSATAGQWNASVAGASNLALAAYATASNALAGLPVLAGLSNGVASALASNTWAAAESTTNYIPLTGSTSLSGTFIHSGGATVSFQASSTATYPRIFVDANTALGTAIGLAESLSVAATIGVDTNNPSTLGQLARWSGASSKATIWDRHNDGSGSGLDADLFDGLDSTAFLRNLLVTTNGSGDAVTNVAVSVSGTNGTIDIQRGTITSGGGAAQSPITGIVNYAGFNIQDARMVEANALRIGQRSPYTGGNTTDWNTVTNVWDGSQGSWFRSGVRQSAIMSGGTNYMGLNVFGAAIVAGYFNSIDASYCAIGGGADHYILGGLYSIIGGGQAHTGNAAYVTISGGKQNRATGVGATVPGGSTNVASGAGSFAAGRQATASADGAFAWNSVSTNGVTNATAQSALFNVPGGFRIQSGGGNVWEFNGTNLLLNGVIKL